MKQVYVNEAVDVLVRMMPDGTVRPTSFLWRDKTRYVSDVGRQWEERIAGHSLRCFLIRAVDNSSYELRWDPASDGWSIYRAWLPESMV